MVIPGGDSVVPVPDTWVTLHRVGADRAGPLDSTRTDARGRYAIRYTRSGASDAVYFLSSTHDGVAYFTAPLTPGAVRGDAAVITVFDTTSRPVPISLRGHHIVLERPGPGGMRRVTEVFDLSNDTSVTRVARDDSSDAAVWSAILPRGAREPAVTDGDIPAAAVRFARGRALVYAALAPGMRQLAYSYSLGDGDFPLTIPASRPTQVLEVLLEEPGASVSAPGLRAVQPAVVSGREFRRFLASDVPATGVISVRVPEMSPGLDPWIIAVVTLVIGGAMTAALALALRRR